MQRNASIVCSWFAGLLLVGVWVGLAQAEPPAAVVKAREAAAKAATEKAAAEKAFAEAVALLAEANEKVAQAQRAVSEAAKAASDRAIRNAKTAADKAISTAKTAADRAAAEQAAAQTAQRLKAEAAQKAAAERAAADNALVAATAAAAKAIAEKTPADKLLTDKTRATKTAAEARSAADKADAEKIAADKLLAEKKTTADEAIAALAEARKAGAAALAAAEKLDTLKAEADKALADARAEAERAEGRKASSARTLSSRVLAAKAEADKVLAAEFAVKEKDVVAARNAAGDAMAARMALERTLPQKLSTVQRAAATAKAAAEKAEAARSAADKAAAEKKAAEAVVAEKVAAVEQTAVARAEAEKAVTAATAELAAANTALLQKTSAAKAAASQAAKEQDADKKKAAQALAKKAAEDEAAAKKTLQDKTAALDAAKAKAAACKTAAEKATSEKTAADRTLAQEDSELRSANSTLTSAQRSAGSTKTAAEKSAAELAAVQKQIAEKEALERAAMEKAVAELAAARGALKPLDSSAWDIAKARHLLARAGFGGTVEEVEKLHALGLHGAVDFIVDYHRQPSSNISFDGVPPQQADPLERRYNSNTRRALSDERNRRETDQLNRLRLWWLERMVESSRPLQEKLTLFWHSHFATEYTVVRNSYAFYQQNQLFRDNAAGNFAALLYGIVHDPVMIRYLDNNQNYQGHPNENLAREIMELFAMGLDQGYTEEDIREAARALTGYNYDDATAQFRYLDSQHDTGDKTIFGRTGNWSGDDLVKLILEQPATARFIAGKLFEFFAYKQPSDETIDSLAVVLRVNNYELSAMLKNLFLSEEFYSQRAMGTQIKSPVQLVVGMLRDLGVDDVSNYAALDAAIQNMGQYLFQPPDVKGWREGRAWINADRIFVRYNALTSLLRTVSRGEAQGVDVVALLKDRDCKTSAEVVDHLIQSCFVKPLSYQKRMELIEYLGELPSQREWAGQWNQVNARLQALLVLMLSTPDYQMT